MTVAAADIRRPICVVALSLLTGAVSCLSLGPSAFWPCRRRVSTPMGR